MHHDMYKIGDLFQANTMLSRLSLFGNKIGDLGIPKLKEVLRNSRNLTSLNLGCM
jgi:hypothetical protein